MLPCQKGVGQGGFSCQACVWIQLQTSVHQIIGRIRYAVPRTGIRLTYSPWFWWWLVPRRRSFSSFGGGRTLKILFRVVNIFSRFLCSTIRLGGCIFSGGGGGGCCHGSPVMGAKVFEICWCVVWLADKILSCTMEKKWLPVHMGITWYAQTHHTILQPQHIYQSQRERWFGPWLTCRHVP